MTSMHRRGFLGALAAGAVMPRSLAGHLQSQAGLWGSPRGDRSAGEVYAMVLGTVQDAGVPQVGCYTDRCNDGRELHAAGRGRSPHRFAA